MTNVYLLALNNAELLAVKLEGYGSVAYMPTGIPSCRGL